MTNRFDPFRDLVVLQDRINWLLEDRLARQQGKEIPAEAWVPSVDIQEDEKEVVLFFDLPGVIQQDVEINVTDEQLSIKGERKNGEEKRKILRRERTVGPFSRSFELNIPVQVGNVSASYKNGVLEIHLPKSGEGKPRKVNIEGE
ncbi:MAG: Hsp20/alpha crystallin family protein [Candidatus Atribacteria bacterium]|nr:Hsp20/alpha crystallin family protein [Candidatus Atribacteria bacterium]